MLNYLVLAITAYVVSLILTPLVRKLAFGIGATDRPGKRKMHLDVMPRLGGVSLALAMALSILSALTIDYLVPGAIRLPAGPWLPIVLGGLIVFSTGLWDDLRSLPASVKLLFESIAAGIAIWFLGPIHTVSMMGGGSLELGLFAVPLTYLWIVGVINAFNLIDGLDGLAAGVASIAAGTSAAIFFIQGDEPDMMLMMLLLGGLLGFLHYNFNPAQIFLGDSGSLLVGYILAVGAMQGSQRSATALAVAIPLLIMGLPIFDTLLSFVRRYAEGLGAVPPDKNSVTTKIRAAKHIFKPDARHIHHRLLAMGLSHRHTVLVLYAVALWLSFMALLSVMSQYRNAGMVLIAVGLATYLGVRKLGYEEMRFLKPGTLLRLYEHRALNHLFLLGVLDMFLIAVSYWGAAVLKYDWPWTVSIKEWHLTIFPVVLAIQLFAFTAFGLYRGVWRATGLADMIRTAFAVASGVALSYIVSQISVPPEGTLTFFCINLLLLGGLVSGSRNIYGILEYAKAQKLQYPYRALIYGAGHGGQRLLRVLLQKPTLGIRPVGFVDDAASLQGRVVNNIPILGSYKDLESILRSDSITTLIVSSDKIADARVEQAIRLCAQNRIQVLRARLELDVLDSASFVETTPASTSARGTVRGRLPRSLRGS